MKRYLCIALVIMTGLLFTGCGLTSGTLFISDGVDTRIESSSGTALDSEFGFAIVNFTDESGWQDYTIEGIEDGCIVLDAWNRLGTTISGAVWITMDTLATTGITSIAQIEAAGGFRIFSGIALPAGPDNPDVDPPTKHFTCAETFAMLENVDQLVAAVQQGYFVVWGVGNEASYSFVYDGIVLGVHVTGSL